MNCIDSICWFLGFVVWPTVIGQAMCRFLWVSRRTGRERQPLSWPALIYRILSGLSQARLRHHSSWVWHYLDNLAPSSYPEAWSCSFLWPPRFIYRQHSEKSADVDVVKSLSWSPISAHSAVSIFAVRWVPSSPSGIAPCLFFVQMHWIHHQMERCSALLRSKSFSCSCQTLNAFSLWIRYLNVRDRIWNQIALQSSSHLKSLAISCPIRPHGSYCTCNGYWSSQNAVIASSSLERPRHWGRHSQIQDQRSRT